MAVTATAPVTDIEGIGPATGARLAEIAVFSVFDLLRADARRIHTAVSELASLGEVRGWRQMAALLEVDEVTPQWAEALVKAGITTVRALRNRRLDQIEAALEDARSSDLIPDLPSPVQIAEMLKDAATLDACGALMGTVRNHAGEAVADALVRVGGASASTDGHGRFRLARLPLGRRLETTIEHTDYTTVSERLKRVPSVRAAHVRTYVLPRRIGPPRPEPVLSQLQGDRLPPMAGQPIVPRETERDELAEYEIVRLILFYANGREAKLVSKLLSYDGGKFVVRWLRMPLSELPEDPVLREHYWFRRGEFTRLKLSPRKLAAYGDFLRYKRSRAPSAPGTTLDAAALEARLRTMQEAGLLRKRRRGGPNA